VYRLDSNILPTKFKDATLSREELLVLQKVETVRGNRIAEICDNGEMLLTDGRVVPLPWKNNNNDDEDLRKTTFVHCSAGAFNYNLRGSINVH